MDESRSWDWLLGVVGYHSPEYVLSCGDWGFALSTDDIYTLLEKAVVSSIYGNHENIGVLGSARSLRARFPVIMRDGRVYEVGGLRVAGISGVISERRKRTRELVPRKTSEEYLSVARSLRGEGIDILLIHEAPYIPELLPSVKMSPSSVTSLEAIRTVEPRLAIRGHVHEDSLEAYRVSPKTRYVRLDSSQLSRRYLVLTAEGGWVNVDKWQDYKLLTRLVRSRVGPRSSLTVEVELDPSFNVGRAAPYSSKRDM